MNFESFGLSGKTVVVTGAGSGIGEGCALAFGKAGAKVVVLEKDLENAERTASTIMEAGGDAVALECDVSQANAVASAAERVAALFGGADILVNNAGMMRPGALSELSLDDWNQILAVNLTGYFICAQSFGRQMIAKGRGAIVNVASVTAENASPFAGAYSVSKAGIQILSRQLAIEWGQFGIRSNCVSPGLIVTSLSEAMYTPEIKQAREAMVPLGRLGYPADVSSAVLFLASDMAQYITGDEITVDGGIVRNLMRLVPRKGYGKPIISIATESR